MRSNRCLQVTSAASVRLCGRTVHVRQRFCNARCQMPKVPLSALPLTQVMPARDLRLQLSTHVRLSSTDGSLRR